MAFFGLFPSSSAPKTESKRPLVVVDWVYARRRGMDLSFLAELDKPLVWVFFQKPNQDSVWKELTQRYTVTPYQSPRSERNLSTFLTATLAYALGRSSYPKVVIVGSRGLYQGLADWITKTAGVPTSVQQATGSEEGETRPPRTNERNTQERNPTKRSEQPARGRAEKTVGKPRQPQQQPTWNEEDLRGYAEQIVAFFQTKYTVGENYRKSFFGMAIKQATGQNTYTVFRTKNAGPFIDHLIAIGCLDLVEPQLCVVKRLPTVEEILALALTTTQRGPRRKPQSPSVVHNPHDAPQLEDEPDEPDDFSVELDEEAFGTPPVDSAPDEAPDEELVWDELDEAGEKK